MDFGQNCVGWSVKLYSIQSITLLGHYLRYAYLSPGAVLLTNDDVTSPLTGGCCCCCCQCADDDDDDGAAAAWGELADRSPTTDILLALSKPAWSLRGTLIVRGTVRGNVGTAAPDTAGPTPAPPWYESTPVS